MTTSFALLDTATFSSAHGTTAEAMGPEPTPLRMMIFMDPPEHTWHRKVVNRAFTPKTVADLESRVVDLCGMLLDQFQGREEVDLLEEYGAVVPPSVILALLGFPPGFEKEWRQSVDSMLSVPGAPAERSAEQTSLEMLSGESFTSGLFQLLPDLLTSRRADPSDDLISVLVQTDLEENGHRRKLTDEEIFSFVLLLSAAGTETVARLLGWALTLLDRRPAQRGELAADPTLIPNAIEECLRYEAPSPVNGRWVNDDVEFHGEVIPRHSKVLLLNGSGNRDERHFADPNSFDIHRRIDRHLSFGYGPHFCVGAALARMEGHVALRELLRRYPTWQIDYEGAQMVHTSTVRGYAKLPASIM